MTSTSPSEVVVVGAGPAGIAAAVAAAEAGARVTLIDGAAQPGGQVWKAPEPPGRQAREWLRRLDGLDVVFRASTQIVAFPSPGLLLAETPDGPLPLSWTKLILAPGARELFIPFPGWTLPNVVGVGALQALIKGGVDVCDRRILVAGSGPLLWVTAACAQEHGADVGLIAEQAPAAAVAAFATQLVRYPRKWWQAACLRLKLAGVPIRSGVWPVRARGTDRVREVEFTDGRSLWVERCDYLACAFGLVPQLELPLLAGCAVRQGTVAVDAWQQSSIPGIYCAGEVTGIGGVDKAIEEGLIAGLSAVDRREQARARFVHRATACRFADQLRHAYQPRAELRGLADRDTIVCRCEDVTRGQLEGRSSWREAKLYTRSGMGACQGRVCGAATRVLFGFGPDAVRPPALPARLETLAAAQDALQCSG